MRKTTCIDWFEKNLKEIAAGNGSGEVTNTAIVFTKKAKAGMYDLLPDDLFKFLLEECDEVSSLWLKKPKSTYFQLLAEALGKLNMDNEAFHKIAQVMAESYEKQTVPFKTSGELMDEDNIVRELGEWEEEELPTQQFRPNAKSNTAAQGFLFTPQEIYKYLSKRIYGQQDAVKAASMLLYNHTHGHKRNLLFAGPTGCGKTEIWRVLRQIYPEIHIVDSTRLTMEGWSGSYKVRDIFSGMSKAQAESSVIVFDEFDKFCEPLYGTNGTNYSISCQNELLKLIEGAEMKFEKDKDREALEFDSSKISFVFCGSFERLVGEKREKENPNSIGFGASVGKTEKQTMYLQEFTPEDLVKYAGMRQEIAGRINRIVQLLPMSEDDFDSILSNEYISPLRKLERQYHIKLRLTGKVRRQLAREAARNQMGVRYLHSRLQTLLDEQMFEDCEKYEYELGV